MLRLGPGPDLTDQVGAVHRLGVLEHGVEDLDLGMPEECGGRPPRDDLAVLALPDRGSGDEVGAPLELGHRDAEVVGHPQVVVIDVGDVPAPRLGDAGVDRPARDASMLQHDESQPRVLVGDRSHVVVGVVGAAVRDDEELEDRQLLVPH